MRLIDCYEQFILEYQKPNTRRSYQYIILPFIHHIGRGWQASDVAKIHLLRYLEELEAGEVRTIKGDAAVQVGTPASRYKHIKGLKRFFNYLLDEGIIESSPAERIRNPKPSRKIKPDKAITDDELDAMLSVCEGIHPRQVRQRALIHMLFSTGARANGISNLTLDKINWKAATVIILEDKREKEIICYPDPPAMQALREYIMARPATDIEYVFVSVNGEIRKMSSDAIRSMLRRVAKKAGIKRPIGSHKFRHRFGEDLARNNVSPSTAALLMGHDNPQTTIDHYYNYNQKEAEQAARQLYHRREDQQAANEFKRRAK